MSTLKVPKDYLHFCRSPLHSTEDIEKDYLGLMTNSFVKSIGFHKPHILMVETDTVIINYDGEEIAIGDFIIFIVREQDDLGYWRSDFFFSNYTRALKRSGKDGEPYLIHHPHIISSEPVTDINQKLVGELCIQSGGHELRQAIRMGNISSAVAKLKIILHTMDTGQPFTNPLEWINEVEEVTS